MEINERTRIMIEKAKYEKSQRDIQESTDILAKLLATENLHIIDGGCETSYIDLKNRVMRIVRFKSDSPLNCKEVRITSIGHECGHALFTPESLIHSYVDKKYPNLFPFVNLVEDIRIEKLIRNKFKGIHKTMKAGRAIMYREGHYGEEALNDPNSLNIFNKIILYTKVDKNINGLQLSLSDESVVRYVERHAVDEQSVIKCAKFLYVYCKEHSKFQKNIEELLNQLKQLGGESDDSDYDSDDGESGDSEQGDYDADGDESDMEDDQQSDYDVGELQPGDSEVDAQVQQILSEMEKAVESKANSMGENEPNIKEFINNIDKQAENSIKESVDSVTVYATIKKGKFSSVIQEYTPTVEL